MRADEVRRRAPLPPRLLDLGVGGVEPAEADVVARRSPRRPRCPAAPARYGGAARRDRRRGSCNAVERDRAALRIVETQDQMEDRALARAGRRRRARAFSPGLTLNDTPSSTNDVGPRRIGKAHIVEGDFRARAGSGSATGLRRRAGSRGSTLSNLEQPLGRARGLRRSRPRPGSSSPKPLAANTAYSTNWPSRARRDASPPSRPARRPTASMHDAATTPGRSIDGGEHRARLGRLHARLHRRARPRRRNGAPARRLVGEGLQRAHRADQLGWRRPRHRPACPARCASGVRTERPNADQRQHDHRNGAEHEQPRAWGS